MRIPHQLAAAALLALACTQPAAAQQETLDYAAGRWSYAGPNGPAFWSTLDLRYHECGQRQGRQSPVNLPAGSPAPYLSVEVDYPASAGILVNSGHGVDLLLPRPPDTMTLTVADSTFNFREVHFHVPAEHTVQGRRYDAEIHTVHQQGGGNRVVLATFVQEGTPNPGWFTLIDSLPGNVGDTIPVGVVDLNALLSLRALPSERLYDYGGSLTTPPCTSNVRFLIRQRPIVLSRDQIEALSSAMVRNVRPVQTHTHPVVRLHRPAP